MLWLYGIGLLAGVAEVATFWRSYQTCLAIEYGVYLALAASGATLIASLADGAARGASPLARRRARVVLVGALVAFLIPLVALLGSVLFGEHVSFSLLAMGGFIFPASIGYAIARHDLFEADRVVKLSLVYTALTLMVSLLYAGTVVLADRLVAESPVSRSPLFPIGFVMLALATIVPLRDRVQRAVDRLFYRGRVDFKDTVARASGRMTTLLDRDAIVEHVTSTLRDVLFVDGATVWERDGEALVRRGGSGRLPLTDPGLVAFEAHGRMLSRDEVEESIRLRPVRSALRALFVALDASLLVPLLHQGRSTGVLTIGRKAAGGGLSADDVDVLATLANETAIALANASAVEQLDAAREGLRRAEHLAAIGELSAAVAHGIRNPLAGIRLAAQIGLEHTTADGPVRESLQDVLAEVDKLEAQVRGILDFARPFEPRLEATDLPALVHSVLETLTSRLDAVGVAVAVDMPRDLPRVRADRAHLGQAFQELVANAIEAMPAGGRLTVSAAPSGNGVPRIRLAVADSGPGVPAEMRERIFGIFTTTKQTGTGVGLAVVRKIVERHGGRVTVEQAEPHGARFVIELPAA
jgi:signal transduction histidine kinase